MSYEGSREFLCAKGHYTCIDCYDDDPIGCAFCGAPMAFVHSIDETNGREEGNPHTMPAPKEKMGHDDDWRTDHHGNDYAVMIHQYRPTSEWRPVPPQDSGNPDDGRPRRSGSSAAGD